MKRLLKFISYFILIVVLFVVLLSLVAKLSENKITDIALRKVSESIQAPVTIDNVSFSLIRKFPYATIELSNITLGSSVSADSINQTESNIAEIEKVYVSVKTKPLIRGEIEIVKVDIKDADINYFVDTNGVSNIDFLINSSDTTLSDTVSKALNLTLKDLSGENIHCKFIDKSIKAGAEIYLPKLKLEDVKLAGNEIMAAAKGELELTNVSLYNTNLYLMQKTSVDFDVNYIIDSIDVKQLTIQTDGAAIDIQGNLVLTEKIKSNLKINGTNLVLNELVKYVPDEIIKEYGLNQLAGILLVNADVNGNYSESEMPQINLKVNMQNGSVFLKEYPEVKNINFSGEITNGVLRNNTSTQATFETFHFETDKSKFDFNFSILDLDQIKYDIKSKLEIDIAEFGKFIPDTLMESIDGKINASFSTKGELPDSVDNKFIDNVLEKSTANIVLKGLNVNVNPNFSIKDLSSEFIYRPNFFAINNLNIIVPEYSFNLQNTSLDARFNGGVSDLSKLAIDISKYHLETKGAEISGYLKVKDLKKPNYDTETQIKLNLIETRSMLPDTLLNQLNGLITLNIKSKAIINPDSIKDQIMELIFDNSSFKISAQNVTVELANDPLYKMENFSGNISIANDVIEINKMFGVAAGIDFSVDSTRIENMYKAVLQNNKEQLLVDTRLGLGDLDYSMLSLFMDADTIQGQKTKNTEAKPAEVKNYTMLVKGLVHVNSFRYDKVLVEDISTLFNVQDSVYILDQFKLKAFEGSMNSSIKYTVKPNTRATIETHHIIEKMDVKSLLADFDNFKDYYDPAIKAENLSGLFSTDIFTRIVMENNSMIQEDMRVRGAFKIENGGVYNFEPATNLSKFTGIDELDNIKFKTLESNIFIIKNAIYVPETFISSTAVDITAYGMQSFGEDYEYHLKLKLSDILFGKSEKVKKKQAKSGDKAVEDDRNKREIVSYSIDGKNKNGFDNSKLQNDMKRKIMMQDKLLDLRFNPRLFNFETNVYSK